MKTSHPKFSAQVKVGELPGLSKREEKQVQKMADRLETRYQDLNRLKVELVSYQSEKMAEKDRVLVANLSFVNQNGRSYNKTMPQVLRRFSPKSLNKADKGLLLRFHNMFRESVKSFEKRVNAHIKLWTDK